MSFAIFVVFAGFATSMMDSYLLAVCHGGRATTISHVIGNDGESFGHWQKIIKHEESVIPYFNNAWNFLEAKRKLMPKYGEAVIN